MMPSCFHETSREKWESSKGARCAEEDLEGWSPISTRLHRGMSDPGNWRKGTRNKGEKAVFYLPSETLMDQFERRIPDSGQPVTDQVIPFGSLRGAWV